MESDSTPGRLAGGGIQCGIQRGLCGGSVGLGRGADGGRVAERDFGRDALARVPPPHAKGAFLAVRSTADIRVRWCDAMDASSYGLLLLRPENIIEDDDDDEGFVLSSCFFF